MQGSITNFSRLMSDFNFGSKYAKHNPELRRREVWEESVDRMMEMHLSYYKDKLLQEDIEQIGDVSSAIKRYEVLGSQRALQFGGRGVLQHHMRSYNCSASYCDRPRFFAECFYLLLCGAGVGFSVQTHHVEQLPFLRKDSWGIVERYLIEDSIEGWSNALNELVNFWLGLRDTFPAFDYSSIRAKGELLSTGGKAPGPEPLQRALGRIQEVFKKAFLEGPKLRPIHCYDIVMHTSDAVLSGGVRRSAALCVFSPDDEEMLNAKTGNWTAQNPQRARSNNSALLIRNEDNLTYFKRLMKASRQFGEPGFIFANSREHIFNPCVEVSLLPLLVRDPSGAIVDRLTLELIDYRNRDRYENEGYTFESGWECCNLSEMNASVWQSKEDGYNTVRRAAILGTLQAGYTDTRYLGEVSRLIIEREALLGISMTGIMDNPRLIFDAEFLATMAELAIEVNKIWAKKLGIRSAARVTCVKPAGNSTVLLSREWYLTSGCHPQHAAKMFRRIQVSKDDPLLPLIQQSNPNMVEESVWSAGKTDVIITFPIVARPGALLKDDISAIDFLEKVKFLQEHWVSKGNARPESAEGMSHNVSNTCEVAADEWNAVGRFIYENRYSFAGISFIGKSGDYMYPQAPMQGVLFENELKEMFGSINVGAAKHARRLISKNFGDIYTIMTPLKMVMEGYTAEEAVKGTAISAEALWEVYHQVLALIHLRDTDELLLLLASIGHEDLWHKIVDNFVDVDFTSLVEEEDNTKATDAVACAGGVCEVDFTISRESK